MNSHLVTVKKIQEQSTLNLINCIMLILKSKKIEGINCYKDDPRSIYKELFKRLINPLYIPVLILVSLFLILTSKENIQYNKNKYVIFFVGLSIIILSETSLGYLSNNLTKNILLSTIPLILVLIFYLFLIYNLKLPNRKKIQ